MTLEGAAFGLNGTMPTLVNDAGANLYGRVNVTHTFWSIESAPRRLVYSTSPSGYCDLQSVSLRALLLRCTRYDIQTYCRRLQRTAAAALSFKPCLSGCTCQFQRLLSQVCKLTAVDSSSQLVSSNQCQSRPTVMCDAVFLSKGTAGDSLWRCSLPWGFQLCSGQACFQRLRRRKLQFKAWCVILLA